MSLTATRFYFYLRKHDEYSKKYFHEIQYGDAKLALYYLQEANTYRNAYMNLK